MCIFLVQTFIVGQILSSQDPISHMENKQAMVGTRTLENQWDTREDKRQRDKCGHNTHSPICHIIEMVGQRQEKYYRWSETVSPHSNH